MIHEKRKCPADFVKMKKCPEKMGDLKSS